MKSHGIILLCSYASAFTLPVSPQMTLTTSPTRSRKEFLSAVVGAPMVFAGLAAPAFARPEGVNKPELLPKAPGQTVIDLEGWLTTGQEKRLDKLIKALEADTGIKLRVLCQHFPNTPGLAIKDYWSINDNTIILIADKGTRGTSNLLNFNVGDGLKLTLPNVFWSRLQGRFGTTFYVRDNGEDQSIMAAVETINSAVRTGSMEIPSEIGKTKGVF
ncbi:unnamed protein product [Chrysoparadoxa australica]